jgi:hypothetical protein
VSDSIFPAENSDESVLDQLARRIREALQKGCAALLHNYMDAGDALNEAHGRVTTSWRRWLQDNCTLSVRTAYVYQQLANNRRLIEDGIEREDIKSIRDALDLISEPKSARPTARENETENKTATAAEPDPVLAKVATCDDAYCTELLRAMGQERILRNMPQEYRSWLQARAGGQVLARAKAKHGEKKLKNLKLTVVGGTDIAVTPTTH